MDSASWYVSLNFIQSSTFSAMMRREMDAPSLKSSCTQKQKQKLRSWSVCLFLKLQPNNHMVAQLNYDILCVLFRFLDQGTLYNCSVVNKEFNFIASQNLYRTVVSTSKLRRLDLIPRSDVDHVSRPRASAVESSCLPRNAAHVRHFEISGKPSAGLMVKEIIQSLLLMQAFRRRCYHTHTSPLWRWIHVTRIHLPIFFVFWEIGHLYCV